MGNIKMSIENESKLKQCKHCNSNVREDHYNRHMKKMHPEIIEKNKQRNRIKVNLYDDSKVYVRIKHKCDYCGKEANRSWMYYNYSGIETTNSKLYLCSGCNKIVRKNSKERPDPLLFKNIKRIRQ